MFEGRTCVLVRLDLWNAYKAVTLTGYLPMMSSGLKCPIEYHRVNVVVKDKRYS